MADFMPTNYEKSKLKQYEAPSQFGYSSKLQRFRNDINMVSWYRIQPNNTNKRTKKLSNTSFDSYPHCEHDPKRFQMTANGPTMHETSTKS